MNDSLIVLLCANHFKMLNLVTETTATGLLRRQIGVVDNQQMIEFAVRVICHEVYSKTSSPPSFSLGRSSRLLKLATITK
jgi:alpha-D-ribose 1-methylphosphonate 5-triphosphate synthase subunit PhnI